MFQMKFNEDFTQSVRDIPHWKTDKDIPENVIKFIEEKSNDTVIYESKTKKLYCSKCLNKLDEHNYCEHCDYQYKKYSLDEFKNQHLYITKVDQLPWNLYDLNDYHEYFVFDVIADQVYLYLIEEEISYYDPSAFVPTKTSRLSIDMSKSYLVEKDGITNLKTNAYVPFEWIDEYQQKTESEEDYNKDSFLEKQFILFRDLDLITYGAYLYTDNLDDLKNTFYKYSKFWKLKDCLKNREGFTITTLTFNPLYFKPFEYLINYKLYNLAIDVPNYFKEGKNFKEIFGIDKKYLNFMVKNDINYYEFKILQIYPTEDIELIRYFIDYCWDNFLIALVKDKIIDLKKLKSYLTKHSLASYNVDEYLDYMHMAKELNLNLQDKEILYPDNLIEAHDHLLMQIELVKDPEIDKKIQEIASSLTLNSYEDDNYVIFPARSIDDLIDESRQQNNCVRTYCKRIVDGDCQIYFMRKKNDVDTSFVTIEVQNNKIVQARIKYNKLPSEEIMPILRNWEKTLMPITLSK